MKAVEILKWLSTNDAFSGVFKKETNEAIVEPKTCDGCMWDDLGDSEYKPIYYPCRECVANKYHGYKYEPKDG